MDSPVGNLLKGINIGMQGILCLFVFLQYLYIYICACVSVYVYIDQSSSKEQVCQQPPTEVG